jgi:hypothetical protein
MIRFPPSWRAAQISRLVEFGPPPPPSTHTLSLTGCASSISLDSVLVETGTGQRVRFGLHEWRFPRAWGSVSSSSPPDLRQLPLPVREPGRAQVHSARHMGPWVRNLHGVVAVRGPDGREEERRGRDGGREWREGKEGREDVSERGCSKEERMSFSAWKFLQKTSRPYNGPAQGFEGASVSRKRGEDEALGRYLSLLPSAPPDVIWIGFLSSSSSVFSCGRLGHALGTPNHNPG